MESQEDNIIEIATESGGAPIESGGAPTESGGAPIESGGAPIEADENEVTHIMFPEEWRNDPSAQQKLLSEFQKDVCAMIEEKYPNIMFTAVAVCGVAVLNLRGFPDFLQNVGDSMDPETVSRRRQAVFAVSTGIILTLEALDSISNSLNELVDNCPLMDESEEDEGGEDTQSSN